MAQRLARFSVKEEVAGSNPVSPAINQQTAYSNQLSAKKMPRTLKDKLIKLADAFARATYPLTLKFPRIERFGLADQLRRAAVSVTANIVEGSARKTDKELRRFLEIAYASLAEAKYLLSFSKHLGYISEADYEKAYKKGEELSKLLWSFMTKLDTKSTH